MTSDVTAWAYAWIMRTRLTKAEPRYVRVEEQNSARVHEVDLERRTCTCRRARGACIHVRKAVDLRENGCKEFHYEVASALHKEVRRGDLGAALHWADHRAATPEGDTYLGAYARKICGEETRNAKYIWMSLEPTARLGGRDYVAAITKSRKKWELASTCALFVEQMRAWDRVQKKRTLHTWRKRSCAATMRAAADHGDAATLLEGVWWLYEHADDADDWAEVDATLAEAISSRFPAIPRPKAMIANFEKATGLDPFEIRFMFVEALCGGWDETMNDFCHGAGEPLPPVDRSLIRRFPDYIYDIHVRRRRARVDRWTDALRPGRPSPGRLDLRWAGQMLGVVWRYKAFAALGMADLRAPWEAVRVAEREWRLARRFDAV
jgi:hypothetical protein